MRITTAQKKALRTIATSDTVAYLRGPQVSGYSKIHGNAETTLVSLGLIREESTGRTVSFLPGTHSEIKVWRLTEAGKVALNQN